MIITLLHENFNGVFERGSSAHVGGSLQIGPDYPARVSLEITPDPAVKTTLEASPGPSPSRDTLSGSEIDPRASQVARKGHLRRRFDPNLRKLALLDLDLWNF